MENSNRLSRLRWTVKTEEADHEATQHRSLRRIHNAVAHRHERPRWGKRSERQEEGVFLDHGRHGAGFRGSSQSPPDSIELIDRPGQLYGQERFFGSASCLPH